MEWFASSPRSLLLVAVTTAAMYFALIVMTRLAGVRSFSPLAANLLEGVIGAEHYRPEPIRT